MFGAVITCYAVECWFCLLLCLQLIYILLSGNWRSKYHYGRLPLPPSIYPSTLIGFTFSTAIFTSTLSHTFLFVSSAGGKDNIGDKYVDVNSARLISGSVAFVILGLATIKWATVDHSMHTTRTQGFYELLRHAIFANWTREGIRYGLVLKSNYDRGEDTDWFRVQIFCSSLLMSIIALSMSLSMFWGPVAFNFVVKFMHKISDVIWQNDRRSDTEVMRAHGEPHSQSPPSVEG